MELYAKTPLITLYWLPDVQVGYTIWVGMPRLEATEEGLAKTEELLREKRTRRVIANLEDIVITPADARQRIADWLQRMGRLKVLHAWAAIPPKSATARLALRSLGEASTINSIVFAQFPTFEEALSWIVTK